MKVTVIGAGNMGSAFVKQLTRAGHQVSITARNLDKARTVAAANPGAAAVNAGNAAAGADVVVLATAFDDAIAALRSVGNLQGKVVIDITNPLTADYMGLTLGHSTSASEEIAKAVPGAEVVKAFNTTGAENMAAPAYPGGAATMLLCGDDELAKAAVWQLAAEVGFEPVDAGPLSAARHLENLALLWIHLAQVNGLGRGIAFRLERK